MTYKRGRPKSEFRQLRVIRRKTSRRQSPDRPALVVADKRLPPGLRVPAQRGTRRERLQLYLIETLLDPQFAGQKTFEVLWDGKDAWGQGFSPESITRIYSGYVKGMWSVTYTDDLDGDGSKHSGWIFTRS